MSRRVPKTHAEISAFGLGWFVGQMYAVAMPRRRDTKISETAEACKFCEIVEGAVPAYIVFEDEISVAFLDYRPLFPGHCLLVTRQHYRTLLELPKELVGPLFENAQRLTKAVQNGMQVDGSFVAMNNIVSQSVPHFHIHVVPRKRGDGLRGFFWPRQEMRDEELQSVRDKIRRCVTQS